VRYEDLRTREVDEYAIPVTLGEVTQDFTGAGNDFRFTAAVAEFAEILRHSQWANDGTLSGVLRVAQDCAVNDEQREFCDLVMRAIRLEDR
jgi:Ca-activated chloride channel family protein